MANTNFTVGSGLTVGNTTISQTTGTITVGNTVIDGSTGDITSNSNLILSGNVTIGNTVIAGSGTSNMAPIESPALTGTPTAPTATTGTNTTQIATTAFVLANQSSNYSLPVASTTVLGGVKQGNNVTIDGNGVVSVSAPVTSLPFSSITSKPSTLAGYGITDGSAAAPVQSVFGRAGNVVLNSSDVTTALAYTPPTPTGNGASGNWSISVTGSAASASYATQAGYANQLNMAQTALNQAMYPTVVAQNGTVTPYYASNFSINPSTGALSATSFSGSGAGLTNIPAAALPTATTTTLGAVKIDGNTITIANGVISSTGGSGASLPTQTGNAGKFLTTDGTTASWAPGSTGASSAVAASLGKSSVQGVTSSAWTKVTLNTVAFDTNGIASTTTSRITPTTAGYYQVTGQLFSTVASGTISSSAVAIYKNGNTAAYQGISGEAAQPGTDIKNCTATVYMNGTTDYFELWGIIAGASPSFSSGLTRLEAVLVAAGAVGSQVPVAASVYRNATQAISNNTWTKVQLNVKQYDTVSMFDATTNYRLIALTAGYYQINASVAFGGTGVTYSRVGLYVNNVFYRAYSEGPGLACTVADVLYLNVGDYVELYASSTASSGNVIGGSTSPATTFMSASLVSNGAATTSLTPISFGSYVGAARTTAGTFVNYTPLVAGKTSNTSTCFDTTTGVFTAPISGVYSFGITFKREVANVGRSILNMYVNGTNIGELIETSSAYQDVGGSINLSLAAGDTVSLYFNPAEGAWSHSVYFSGFIVSADSSTAAPVAFKAYRAASQAITAGTWTKVNLTNETFDTVGAFDSATNYRFHPTTAGYYQLSGTCELSAASGLTAPCAAILKNGAMDVAGGILGSGVALGATSGVGTVSGTIYLNGSTDYVELGVIAITGTTIIATGGADHRCTMSGSLIASASSSTALSSNRNKFINGSLAVWQRGNTFTLIAGVAGVRTADRFSVDNNTDGVISVNKYTDFLPSDAGGDCYTDYFDVTVSTADASLAAAQYAQVYSQIEGNIVAPFGFGRTGTRYITLSFLHKHTATGTYCVTLFNAAQNRRYTATYSQSITDTWEKATITIPVDTTGTWLADTSLSLMIDWPLAMGSSLNTRTANVWDANGGVATSEQVNVLATVNNHFRIAKVQIEAGVVATPFEDKPLAVETQLCQRYCYVIPAGGWFPSPYTDSTSRYGFSRTHPVTMRAAPTVTPGGFSYRTAGTYNDGTATALLASTTSEFIYTVTCPSAPNTAGYTVSVIPTSSWIVSAE